ncbi:hypothetical protein ACFXTI_025205 [Malus domestica]
MGSPDSSRFSPFTLSVVLPCCLWLALTSCGELSFCDFRRQMTSYQIPSPSFFSSFLRLCVSHCFETVTTQEIEKETTKTNVVWNPGNDSKTCFPWLNF